jgi:TPR repeat protein
MAVDMAHHRTRRVRNAGMRGLSQLAAAGINLARYNLGLWHLAGKVAEPDFSMGLSLLEVVAATEKEDLYLKGLANRSMADCYSHGVGVEADPARAAEFNERAAELGVADAAFNLALYHDPKGSGAENRTPDYVKAAKFYQRAADLGHVPAMTNLGILYVSGLAQEPTPGAGRALLARAGELGDEFAVEARAIFGSICPF